MNRHFEEFDPIKEKLRGARPKAEEDLTVEEALLAHLTPLIEDHLITEILRPIKTGKEAVVYCCRADPALDMDLVAAKVYRPRERRSFRRDMVYQQGRTRGSRPDARTLRALGKKTRRAQLHKFNAWIAHEMKTLQILYAAGADVPAPIERVGPVILMEYIGDEAGPAPVLASTVVNDSETETIYRRVLHNVDLFLSHHRVHADLSAYNILLCGEDPTIIDFPQAVDPRYNADAFDLLVRDLDNVGTYFARQGIECVDPIEYALALWRKHVDPNR